MLGRSSLTGVIRVIPALMVVLLIASPAKAQSVVGVLLDQMSQQPIGGAAIQLVDRQGESRAAVMTDSQGRFNLPVPGAGEYKILASRIGFETGESDYMMIEADQRLEATLALPVRAVMMDEIGVEVEGQPWRVEHPPSLWPFFERMERGKMFGFGRFMTRDEIAAQGGGIADLWEIQLMYQGYRTGAIGAVSLGNQCSDPIYYLDGMRISATQQSIDDYISPQDLEGVEVYRRATEMPAEFSGSDSNCGVVVLWSRRGGR
jgi:hypothetical protein